MIRVSSLFMLGAIMQASFGFISDLTLLLQGPNYIVAKNSITTLSNVICAASMLFIFDVGPNEEDVRAEDKQALQRRNWPALPDSSTTALHATSSHHPIKSSFVRRSMFTSTFVES